jgi:hypothetical protein
LAAAANIFAEAGLELQEDGLDVLAGAQAVDAEVHAIAGEVAGAEVADFDGVGEAAAGLDAEIGEDGVAGVGVGNGEVFRLGAGAAAVDFVFVCRAPIVGRGQLDFRRCYGAHGTSNREGGSGVKTELLEVVRSLFTGRRSRGEKRSSDLRGGNGLTNNE